MQEIKLNKNLRKRKSSYLRVLGKEFLGMTPKAQFRKENLINKFDFIKIKNFCPLKGDKRMKSQVTYWKKIFAHHKLDK